MNRFDNVIRPLDVDTDVKKVREVSSRKVINQQIEKKEVPVEEVDIESLLPDSKGFDVNLEDLLSVKKFSKLPDEIESDNIELL